MPEIIITKGDLKIEISLRELVEYLEAKVETVPVEAPSVEPVEEQKVARRTTTRKPSTKTVKIPDEPAVETKADTEAEVEPVETADDVPSNITELKTWFVQTKLDLEKLQSVVLPKYNIRSIGALTDEQVPAFYADLLKIRL